LNKKCKILPFELRLPNLNPFRALADFLTLFSLHLGFFFMSGSINSLRRNFHRICGNLSPWLFPTVPRHWFDHETHDSAFCGNRASELFVTWICKVSAQKRGRWQQEAMLWDS
jgi:hypothetical protein